MDKAAFLLCWALAGCALLDSQTGASSQNPGSNGDGGSGCRTKCREVVGDFSSALNRELDILFVIDNSATMGEEQSALINEFPIFLDKLSSASKGLPSLHVGVVSSDLGVGRYVVPGCEPGGDAGRLQNVPRVMGCSAPQGMFISDEDRGDGVRQRNYQGSLSDAFRCIALLGTDGCGMEQHMASMQRALDGSNGENGGFLRQGAVLAVVIVADEDDCSAESDAIFDPQREDLGPISSFRCTEYGVQCDDRPVSRSEGAYQNCEPKDDSFLYHPDRYVQFLRALKPTSDMVYVAAIAGNTSPFQVGLSPEGQGIELKPSCNGTAYPGVRLRYLVDQFPGRGLFASLCAGIGGAMASLAQDLAASDAQCLNADPVDTVIDGRTEPDCKVVYYYPAGGSTELKPCHRSGTPCYRLEPDLQSCIATNRRLSLVLEQGDSPPAPGAHVVIECTVSP